jgi:short-subunit dehydrogenase
MLERRVGHIVNIASLGGKNCLPYNATDSAGKAVMIEWTQAMQIELRGTGRSGAWALVDLYRSLAELTEGDS